MKRLLVYIVLTTVFSFSVAAQNDFDIIKSKIINELFTKNSELQLAKAVLTYKNINAEGSWPDINYQSTDATKWPPATHLERLQQLAIAYANPKSIYHNNSSLYADISKGLAYWVQKNPRSSNWWHNDIASPQSLGRILLLMNFAKQNLPQQVESAVLARMQGTQSPFNFTGANKLDIAIHYIYRALITGNEKLMNMAVLEAFQPIEFTIGEGLQYDFSYLQHKEQLMISAYGLVFLQGEYNVAAWLSGTKYALSKEKLKLLNNYFFNSFLNSLRGGFTDFNTEGRGISRPNGLNRSLIAKNDEESGLLYNVALVNPDKIKEIDDIGKRVSGQEKNSFQLAPAHYYYWRGDYTQHVRPAYSFNVRTVSSRTIRTESGNNENLLGTVLPDGSTNIVRRGNEYFNIMPVWEWDKIPGVTSRDYDTAVTIKKNWGEYGSTEFVGGISDSLYGVTVYSQDYDGVKAKKGYFFFDDEIVCLGAGIESLAPQSITTTVNQAWHNGLISLNENNKITLLKKSGNFKNLLSVWHDSIAYFFPSNQNIFVSNETQSGNWNSINKNHKGDVKGNVFKLWVDHGKAISNASYEYIIVPGIAEKNVLAYSLKNIQIIANTEELQAVKQNQLNIVQAIFYQPGSFTVDGLQIKAEQPCVLQLKGNKVLSVTDPTHTQKEINVYITSQEMKEKLIKIKLPGNPYSGATIQKNLN